MPQFIVSVNALTAGTVIIDAEDIVAAEGKAQSLRASEFDWNDPDYKSLEVVAVEHFAD